MVRPQIKTADEIKAELDALRAQKENERPTLEKKDWYGLVFCDPGGYCSIADLDGEIWLGKTDEVIPYLKKNRVDGENIGSVLLAVEDFRAEQKNQEFSAKAKSWGPTVSKTQSCHLALKKPQDHISIPPQKFHRATFLRKCLKNDAKLLDILTTLVKRDIGTPTIHRELNEAGYNIPYRTLGRWIPKMRMGQLL